MITELYIENNLADINTDLPAAISYAIDDIKDFGARNSSFSKTIILPGTSRNKRLFGHIYDLGSGNLYDSASPNINANFNAAKTAQAFLFQSNVQVFKGVLRLLKIVVTDGVPEFECALFGELASFVTKMGNSKLEDLDFSSYNLTYSLANIVASWDNTPGTGVYFPLIDYGNYSTAKHNWSYKTFRPALYVKEYIDKIFEAAGFTYECDLFSTTRFKELIIPHNKKELTKSGGVALDVEKSGTTTFTQADGYNTTFEVPLETQTTLGNFTVNSAETEYTYTPSSPLSGTITINISGSYTKTDASVYFLIELLVNGSPTFTFGTLMMFGNGETSGSFDSVNSLSGALTTDLTINQNDVISVGVTYLGTSGNYSISILDADLTFLPSANALIPINLGETIPVNDSIPSNILQRDFFSSIVKLFNLYVYESRDRTNHLIIKPFIDFFQSDPSTFDDWTDKVDRSKAWEITPLGELNSKYYHYRYKRDTDYYNELYSKRYNENYGDRIFDSQFEFANDSSGLDVIFSGTPLVGYTGEEKVYSTIFRMSNNIEENTDSNIRILQTKKITGVASWDILNGVTVLGSYTYYGYAGSLDNPDAPNADLNFGVPHELFFDLYTGNLLNNQFALYHSAYLNEIIHKDSKILKCSVYLKPSDIFNLDFSKYKYIDGSIFKLNRIDNYDAINPGTCTVELLKTIEAIY